MDSQERTERAELAAALRTACKDDEHWEAVGDIVARASRGQPITRREKSAVFDVLSPALVDFGVGQIEAFLGSGTSAQMDQPARRSGFRALLRRVRGKRAGMRQPGPAAPKSNRKETEYGPNN